MSFISLDFIAFFALVLLVCARLGHRWQNRFLVLASYVFYGWWDWRFLGLILVSSLVDYRCAISIDREQQQAKRRKLILVASILVNLGILGEFKYYGFFVSSLRAAAASAGVPFDLGTLDIILPVGHLLLHISVDELHHRCVPRKPARHAQAWRLLALRLLLPSTGSRSHRARDASLATSRKIAPHRRQRTDRWSTDKLTLHRGMDAKGRSDERAIARCGHRRWAWSRSGVGIELGTMARILMSPPHLNCA